MTTASVRLIIGVGLVCLLSQFSPAATFNIANGDVTGLINAINTANGNGQDNTINLATAGTYTLTAVYTGQQNFPCPTGLPQATAIYTHNTLTVLNSTFDNNSYQGVPVALPTISCDVALTVSNSTFANSAGNADIGVYGSSASAAITDCTFASNVLAPAI